jgi:hypothetical protein
MIKSILERLGMIAALLGVVAGAAYAVSPWLLSTLGAAWLQNLGAHSVTLVAAYPGWRSMKFSAVRGRLTTDAARYGLAARDLEISYRIGDLLRGRASGVRTARAELSVDSGGALEARDLSVLLGLPGEWIRSLRLDSAAVDELAVRFGGEDAGLLEARLSGRLAAEGHRLVGVIEAGLGRAVPQTVSVDLGADGDMALSIRQSGAAGAQPWLTLRSARAGVEAIALKASLDTRAETATAALSPLLPAGGWDAVAGWATGQWDLVLPTTPADWPDLLLHAHGTAQLAAELRLQDHGGTAADLLTGELKLNSDRRTFASSGTLTVNPGVLERMLPPLASLASWPRDVPGTVSVSWDGSVPTGGADSWGAVLGGARATADVELAVGGQSTDAGQSSSLRGESHASLAAGRLESRGAVRGDIRRLAEILAPWPAASDLPAPAGQLDMRWAAAAPVPAPPHPDGWLGVLELEGTVAGDVAFERVSGLARKIAANGDVEIALRRGQLDLRAAPGLRVRGIPDSGPWTDLPDTAAPVTLVAPRGLAAGLQVHARRYRLNVPRGAEIELRDLVLSNVAAPSLLLRALDDIELSHTGANGWVYDSISLSVRAPVVFANLEALGPIENVAGEIVTASQPGGAAPVMTFRDLGLDTLGGRLSTRRFEYDPERAVTDIEVDVSGVDLGRVVRLEQQPGLQASGRVDGRLSLRVGRDGVASGTGRLKGRPAGGVIRYAPNAAARRLVEENPGLKFAHNALGNLHYDALTAEVDYGADGRLTLNVRIEGINPDWRKDQPIRLNLNLEENIPKLMESLRISDDFSRVIENRMKEFFQSGNGGT